MELPMFLDVPDLPAFLKRWDSNNFNENVDLLTVPSFDDMRCTKGIEYVLSLDSDDESSSGNSLESSPSNASSTLNAGLDLKLDIDFEIFDDSTGQTGDSIPNHPCSPSIASLPTPLLPGRLNLKLDFAAVANTWREIAGNAPVMRTPLTNLDAFVPSATARAASLAVETQEELVAPRTTLQRAVPGSPTNAPHKIYTINKPVVSKPTSSRPTKKPCSSTQKRRTGGKSSDKRPRIKGRFVKREELARYLSDMDSQQREVPDTSDLMTTPSLDCSTV